MIKTLFKLLYALILVVLGASISIYFVSLANLKHSKSTSEIKPESIFPDYIEITQNNYSSFKKMESHFHTYTPNKMAEIEKHSICLNCHSPFPHIKDTKVRAFNNQHYKYLTCESCHFNSTEYEWYDFETDNSITRYEKYGLNEKVENKQLNKNYISKISPKTLPRNFLFYNEDSFDKYKSSINSKNSDNYNKFRKLAEANLATAKTCINCHSIDSSFPWENLGFNDSKISQMNNNAIVNMITKYDTFHFPPIYDK